MKSLKKITKKIEIKKEKKKKKKKKRINKQKQHENKRRQFLTSFDPETPSPHLDRMYRLTVNTGTLRLPRNASQSSLDFA
jgi:hypothetical protein